MKKLIKLLKINTFILSITFTFIGQATLNKEQFFKGTLTLWDKKNWQNTGVYNRGINFLRDEQGKKFVLKYHSHYQLALNEVLASIIGSSIDTRIINQVIIAPSDYTTKDSYATLHTHALGKEVAKTEKSDLVYIRHGLLNQNILKSITTHNDLPKIVAINLFLNDGDCHNYNLFFSKKHDRFCAIDKGLIFDSSYHLATDAYNFLQQLKNDPITWSQIKSLVTIKSTLHTLIERYPPEKIYAEWKSLAEKNNFPLKDQEKKEFFNVLDKNYEEIKKLYAELEYITQNKFLAKALLFSAKETTTQALTTFAQVTKGYVQFIGKWGSGFVGQHTDVAIVS